MSDLELQYEAGKGQQPPKTAVLLPCSPDEFASFIASLLGRPQELVGGRSGQFKVDKAEAMQLYHLVTQRVYEQHGTHPLQFTARIQFDNGTSTLVNTVEDFESYHEVRAIQSTGLFLSWTYVLQFPDAKTPQKQEIEFAFLSRARKIRLMGDFSPDLTGTGSVHYRIRHTARTWGSDIEALLGNYIDSLIKPESQSRKFLREKSSLIASVFGVLMFGLVLAGLMYVNSSIVDQQSDLLSPALGAGVPIPEKLDRLMAFLSAGRETVRSVYSSAFLILGMVGSVAAALWVGTLAESYPPADIVLTKRSVEAHALRQETYEKSLRKLVFSIVASLVLNIAANVVYDALVKGGLDQATVRRGAESGLKK